MFLIVILDFCVFWDLSHNIQAHIFPWNACNLSFIVHLFVQHLVYLEIFIIFSSRQIICVICTQKGAFSSSHLFRIVLFVIIKSNHCCLSPSFKKRHLWKAGLLNFWYDYQICQYFSVISYPPYYWQRGRGCKMALGVIRLTHLYPPPPPPHSSPPSSPISPSPLTPPTL